MNATDQEYQIQYIMQKVLHKGGKVYYQIKWVGFPQNQATFEPEENLHLFDQQIKMFINKGKLHKKKEKKKIKQETHQIQNVKEEKLEKNALNNEIIEGLKTQVNEESEKGKLKVVKCRVTAEKIYFELSDETVVDENIKEHRQIFLDYFYDQMMKSMQEY